MLTTGWACSSGSPNESTRPAGKLTSGQTELNRVRAIAFVSQKIADALIPEELLKISVRMIGA